MNPLFGLVAATILLGTPSDMPVAPDTKMLELVRQLGDQSFQVREAAARDLLKIGGKAIVALNAGTKSSDSEVAERCQRLLPVIVMKERDLKLVDLLRNPIGRPPNGLPGLDRFLSITGDYKTSRHLYADMMNADYAIFEAMEENPAAGSLMMEKLYGRSENWWENLAKRWAKEVIQEEDNLVTFGDRLRIAMFFFIRSDKRFVADPAKDPLVSEIFFSLVCNQMQTGWNEDPFMKKLFLNWLGKEQREAFAMFGLRKAVISKMAEALPIALKIVSDPTRKNEIRAEAILSLAKIGSKGNLKNIEPFLTETAYVRGGVQMRDVAMAVSIHLNGQKLPEFGFNSFACDNFSFNRVDLLFFQDNSSREAAHAKWKAWLAKQAPPEKN